MTPARSVTPAEVRRPGVAGDEKPANLGGARNRQVRLATVAGREHVRVGRNNQDGASARVEGEFAVAVVTDGCSAGRSSEVGARLGAEWLARAALELAQRDGVKPQLAALACEAVLRRLRMLLFGLSAGEKTAFVAEQLLFTCLCAVSDAANVLVFGIGDGVVAVDGRVRVFDPGEQNAPAYLAYRLLEPVPMALEELTPRVHHFGRATRVVLATDGLAPVSARLCDWASDLVVAKNPVHLQRLLNVCSAQDKLGDDATVAVLTREEG